MATVEKPSTFQAPGQPGSPVQCKERYENFIGGAGWRRSRASTGRT